MKGKLVKHEQKKKNRSEKDCKSHIVSLSWRENWWNIKKSQNFLKMTAAFVCLLLTVTTQKANACSVLTPFSSSSI